MAAELHLEFAHDWKAKVLPSPPLIAPSRAFVYPRQVAGEEDTLARGAMLVEVTPANAENFLATCALGFAGEGPLSGVWSCPAARQLCAVAGGYAYIVDTLAPETCTHLQMRPVVQVIPAPETNLLVFVDYHSLAAWGPHGMAWQTRRITWEGLTEVGVHGRSLRGLAWDMVRDRDVEFAVDLRDGTVTGGVAAF